MTMKRGHGADSKTSDWKQRYCAIRDVTLVWLSWSRRLVVTCLIIGLIMRAQIIFLTQTRRMISCSLFLAQAEQPIKNRQHNKFFDCSKIDMVTVVKELGRGKQKTVYEVTLPTGEHVAAKRCNCLNCEVKQLLANEERYFRTLYETFPANSLRYYGFCSFHQHGGIFDSSKMEEGSTLFVEMGTPVLETWDGFESNEFTALTSKDDLDALRDIARLYDVYPGGPLRMHGDNKYPHQYMRNQHGQLVHIDFDMVDQMSPPTTSTLDENCNILLTGFAALKHEDPRVNCTVGYQQPEDDPKSENAKSAIFDEAKKRALE